MELRICYRYENLGKSRKKKGLFVEICTIWANGKVWEEMLDDLCLLAHTTVESGSLQLRSTGSGLGSRKLISR